MKKVIVVIGPTAVGKTKVGIALAKRLKTEIISGDSVQVYKGLDIGSAKVKESEKDGVVHHLIDILEPTESYSVCDFQKAARALIDKLEIPLIVGGTGLYIKACLANYEFNAYKRDAQFENAFVNYSNDELYQLLLEKDPKQAEKIHPNNRHRVLRAIQAAVNQEPLSKATHKDDYLYDAYIIYLNVKREILYQRINERVDMMFDEGLLEEVKALYTKSIEPKAIGYQEFVPYFKGDISLEQVKEDIKKHSRQLAKRQMTWFNNQMNTHFYEVNLFNIDETIEQIYQDVISFIER